MKESFTNEAGVSVVEKVIETIKSNREYLSEVDSVGGDGDHGINMNKGFTMAEKEIEGQAQFNMSEGFKIVSGVLVNKIGGSMGPLYGSFFRGLSVASRKETEITKEVFGVMLEKAYQNIAMLTEAKIGDKTLMDVLIPAVETYKSQLVEKCLRMQRLDWNQRSRCPPKLVEQVGSGTALLVIRTLERPHAI